VHTSTNEQNGIETNYWEMSKGIEKPMPFTKIYYRNSKVCKAKCTSMKVACSTIIGRCTTNRDWSSYVEVEVILDDQKLHMFVINHVM